MKAQPFVATVAVAVALSVASVAEVAKAELGPPPPSRLQLTLPTPLFGQGYGPPPPGYGPPPPGYAQPQQHPARRPRRQAIDAWYSIYFDLLSLRVGSYDIRGSDADKRTWGFLFSLDPDIIVTVEYLTYRSILYAAIGGGTDGLEGRFDWSWGLGLRGYFGDEHGPFVRAGMGLSFLGNNKIYRSFFELPELSVGYQVHTDAMFVELAANGGLILGGRYFTGDDARRRIDTEFEWGGRLTLQTDGFRLNSRFMRIHARQTDPGTPIDELSTQLCINPFGMVLLCGDGAWHRGDVRLPDGRFSTSTATYFGATLGLGLVRTGSPGNLLD